MKKLIFLSLFLVLGISYAEFEQPPFEVKDPAVTENFRAVYQSIDQIGVTKSDEGYTCIDDPALCVDADGSITQSYQPSFLLRNDAGQSDLTGDGTEATVTWEIEVRDAGGDVSNSTFTAPVTGQYILEATVLLSGIGSGHTGTAYMSISTSNKTYYFGRVSNAYVASQSNQYLQFSGCILESLDAGEIAYVRVYVAGGTKVVDVFGDDSYNHFSGTLLN